MSRASVKISAATMLVKASAQRVAGRGREIVREVAAQHGLTVAELRERTNAFRISRVRHEAMWRVYRETPLSAPQVAALVGVRDHTTVLYGIAQHEARQCSPS